MKLHRLHPNNNLFEATPEEIREAVRPHIHYRAAVSAAAVVIERWFGPDNFDEGDEGDAIAMDVVEAVLAAALRADEREFIYKPPNQKEVRHHVDCLHDEPGVTVCTCVPLQQEGEGSLDEQWIDDQWAAEGGNLP